MIEISIIDSPDKEIVGHHRYYLSPLILGPSPTAHLLIGDPDFGGHGIFFHTGNDGLEIQREGGEAYFSGGKKVMGKKKHQKGDRITVGNTTIEITDFAPEGEGDISEEVRDLSRGIEREINRPSWPH